MPKALVTGASGFVGPYLIEALAASGRSVTALSGSEPAEPLIPPVSPPWRCVDMIDRAALAALVADEQPDELYHLAALSSVSASFDDPIPTYMVNTMGTLYLLDAVRRASPRTRVLLVSSAEVYGGMAPLLDEQQPYAPASPYAGSKAAAEVIALQHMRAHGLHVVSARAFNHTGPGQFPRFAVPSFARQIARIERGLQPATLAVGNLDARRDFLDVRDVVAAYLALMAHGQPGRAYNVCSGKAVALKELLDGLLKLAAVGIEVRRDPALERPVDVPELRGDPAALQAATGWQPRIPLEQTLSDVLSYWRAKEPFVGDAAPSFA